jgi:hypothetical protein
MAYKFDLPSDFHFANMLFPMHLHNIELCNATWQWLVHTSNFSL